MNTLLVPARGTAGRRTEATYDCDYPPCIPSTGHPNMYANATKEWTCAAFAAYPLSHTATINPCSLRSAHEVQYI